MLGGATQESGGMQTLEQMLEPDRSQLRALAGEDRPGRRRRTAGCSGKTPDYNRKPRVRWDEGEGEATASFRWIFPTAVPTGPHTDENYETAQSNTSTCPQKFGIVGLTFLHSCC